MKRLAQSTIKVALSVTFLFATMLMVVPTKALDCKNVNIVFMRGSSQNYSPNNSEDVNFPTWFYDKSTSEIVFDDYRKDKTNDKEPAFVTSEKEAMKYFKFIGDRVHKQYPTLTMQFVSLHDIAGKYNSTGYRAVSAFGPWSQAFVSRNAIDAKFGSIDGGEYRQSVQDGADELAGYLEDQMVSCPSQLNIVGGFSQGAHVVGEAMQKMHDRGKDNLLSRLGHVDLYGDPKFNGFELTTSRLNPLQKHVTMPWTRGSASPLYAGSLGPRKPYVPDILTSSTTSWCDQFDIVCGGMGALNVYAAEDHGKVYRDDGGYIEQSANEIFVDIKTRLGLIAGLTDTSANSPLAFWNGIKKPQKLDVMFVVDRTGDENLSLLPDPDYISHNVVYLAESGYTSTQVGVVTYTEFSRFDGTKNLIESTVKTVSNLSLDIVGNYSYFKSTWGPAHFQNPPYGGSDLQDSPYSGLDEAITKQSWRKDARRVVVLFSNTWGKETEDTTNLTMKKVTAKARNKGVEILPIFTSKTFRADAGKVNNIPAANAFWTQLAKTSNGHMTEVSGMIEEKLIYDVIMSHIYAPDVEISIGKSMNVPKTKVAASSTIKSTKPVLKKGKKVTLSAAKTTSAKSKVITYKWDTNGDGVTDETSTAPDLTTSFDSDYDGVICVEAVAADGTSSSGCQDVQITADDSLITHEDPNVPQSVSAVATRQGGDVLLSWSPVDGDIIFTDSDGSIMAVTSATAGTLTLRDAPTDAFTLYATISDGNMLSDPTVINVEAIPITQTTAQELPTPTESQNSDPTNGTTSSTTTPPQQTESPLPPTGTTDSAQTTSDLPIQADPAQQLTEVNTNQQVSQVLEVLAPSSAERSVSALSVSSSTGSQSLSPLSTASFGVLSESVLAPASHTTQQGDSDLGQNTSKVNTVTNKTLMTWAHESAVPKIKMAAIRLQKIALSLRARYFPIIAAVFIALWGDTTSMLILLVLLLILLDLIRKERERIYRHQ